MTEEQAIGIWTKREKMIACKNQFHKLVVETRQVDFILENDDFATIRKEATAARNELQRQINLIPHISMDMYLRIKSQVVA